MVVVGICSKDHHKVIQLETRLDRLIVRYLSIAHAREKLNNTTVDDTVALCSRMLDL